MLFMLFKFSASQADTHADLIIALLFNITGTKKTKFIKFKVT